MLSVYYIHYINTCSEFICLNLISKKFLGGGGGYMYFIYLLVKITNFRDLRQRILTRVSFRIFVKEVQKQQLPNVRGGGRGLQ